MEQKHPRQSGWQPLGLAPPGTAVENEMKAAPSSKQAAVTKYRAPTAVPHLDGRTAGHHNQTEVESVVQSTEG
jgi:hypothetical protein